MRFKFISNLSISALIAGVLSLSSLSFAKADELSGTVAVKPGPRNEVLVCEGVDGEVRFEILFYISGGKDPTQAVSMRVSDPNVAPRYAEIALFDAADGLLNSNGNIIVGYVDLTNPKTGRKGERIGGTVLGALRSIMIRLDVDVDIAAATSKKQSAQAVYLKKIGEELVQDLDCAMQR